MKNLNRRDFAVALGASTLGLTNLVHASGHSQSAPAAAAEHEAGGMAACLKNCHDCALICMQTLYASMRQGGRAAAESHLTLLLNCAQMCHLSSQFMASSSEFMAKSCALCAQVCERCAQACAALGHEHPDAPQCVEACRRCAKTCREMAA